MHKRLVAIVVVTLFVAGCAGGADSTQGDPGVVQGAEPAAGSGPPVIELPPVQIGTAPENRYSDEQIERGRMLVSFGSCNDCHTPWLYDEGLGVAVPQMDRMLSGHPRTAPDPLGQLAPGDVAVIGPTFTSFALPFGIVYSLNLTPDMETGTGSWTEEMFLNIFRKAKHLGGEGRPVLPPMPWNWVAHASDDDLVAIFAYLRSITPIKNAVPSSKVPEEVLPFIDAINQGILPTIQASGR